MKTKILSIFLACLMIALIAGASQASKAFVVGGQVAATMAIAGQADPAEYQLTTRTPYMTYKGGKITIKKLDMTVNPPPASMGQPAPGTLCIFIEVDGTNYIVINEGFYADPKHLENVVIYDPEGDTASANTFLNQDLQNKIRRNSQIKVGMYIGSLRGRITPRRTKSFTIPNGPWENTPYKLLTNHNLEAFYRARLVVSMLGDLEGGQNQIVW